MDADPSSMVTLEWVAPAPCPPRDFVLAEITRGASVTSREPLRMKALVAGAERTWRADVELSVAGQTTTRVVEGDSCLAVAEAIAVIGSLALHADAKAGPPVQPLPASPAPPSSSSPPPPAEPPPPPAAPPPAAREEPPATPAEDRRRLFEVGAAALLDVRTLPAVAVGAEAVIGVRPPHGTIEVNGQWLASRDATNDVRPSEGASFWLAHLGARGCYDVLDAAFDVGPCAGAGIEWLVARGFGSDQPTNAIARTATLDFGGRVLARVSPLITLRFGAEGIVPLSRPTFVIENAGLVYEPPGFAVRLRGGADLHF